MNKSKFINLYYTKPLRYITETYGLSRTQINSLVLKYNIKHKSKLDWMDKAGVPANEEEYHKKWKNTSSQPISFWLTNEIKENKYLSTKQINLNPVEKETLRRYYSDIRLIPTKNPRL